MRIKPLLRKIPGAMDLFYVLKRLRGRSLAQHAPDQVFSQIYQANTWGDAESVSGEGSNAQQTALLIRELPAFLRCHQCRSLADIPCGDFHWMKHVDLTGINYLGADIVEDIIEKDNASFASSSVRFAKLNLLQDELPQADILMVRDCLVHLSFSDIQKALSNIKKSRITSLLTTTYPKVTKNFDIVTGQWRRLNLQQPPFNFPPPLDAIVEGSSEGSGDYSDKSLALWPLANLPI